MNKNVIDNVDKNIKYQQQQHEKRKKLSPNPLLKKPTKRYRLKQRYKNTDLVLCEK